MNNDPQASDDRQQLQALLGLLANQTTTTATTSCPSDTQLGNFIDGQLSQAKNQHVLNHLRECESCFETWEISTSTLDELPEVVQHSHTKTKNNPIQRTWHSINQWLHSWQPPVMGLALSLLLMVLIVPKYFLSAGQTAIYSYLLPHQSGVDKVLSQHALLTHEQQTPLGFTPLAETSPQRLAFIAGIDIGKKRLHQQTVNNASDLANYQQLGEWCLLLWTVSRLPTDVDNEFWRQQQQTGQQLSRNLTLSPENHRLLTTIQSLVAQLPQSQQPELYEKLARHLQQLAMVID